MTALTSTSVNFFICDYIYSIAKIYASHEKLYVRKRAIYRIALCVLPTICDITIAILSAGPTVLGSSV